MPRNNGGARDLTELDHAQAAGYEAFYKGLTPSDIPYDEYSGAIRQWWLSGWRVAQRDNMEVNTESA